MTGEHKEHKRFKRAMERHEGEMRTYVSPAWNTIHEKKEYMAGKMKDAKNKAIKTKKEKGYKHQSTLEAIRKNLRKERISYGEIAELGKHSKHLIKSGDIELAEAAGIPEERFNRNRK